MHIALIVILLCYNCVFSQKKNYEPWEPELTISNNNIQETIGFSSLDIITYELVNLYRKKFSISSIKRCPFEISCSEFLLKSIEKYSLLGLPIFIDRFFYRENVHAHKYYLLKLQDGRFKLDDKIFLELF